MITSRKGLYPWLLYCNIHVHTAYIPMVVDIDECLADPLPCTGDHIECHNVPLSFLCICKKGYVMEGDQCVGKYIPL